MTWHEKAYVTLVVGLTFLPFVLSLLLFVWYKQLLLMARWRRWVVIIGMVLAFVASLPLPFFYIALSVLPTTAKSSWLPPVYGILSICRDGCRIDCNTDARIRQG